VACDWSIIDMRRLFFLLLATAVAAICADDPWTAVTKLKSGSEIRVIKKGSTQPVLGKFDEADADRLLLVVKNEQVSIARDLIDRLDARPAQTGPKVKVEGKTTTDDPQAAKEPPVGMNGHPGGSTTSSSTGISLGGNKPDFETVYRRPIGAPKGK
jgi:hypothetical protein